MASFASVSAPPPNPAQQCLEIISAKREYLLGQKNAGVLPSDEDLTALLQRTTADLGPLVGPLGANAQRNLRASFASCGWDVGTNRACGPITPGQVLHAFEAILRGLSKMLQSSAGASAPPSGPPAASSEPAPEPTAEEMSDLSRAVQRLWTLDMNRATYGTDYRVNLQAGKNFHDRRDAARDPLFAEVSGELLSRPTYKLFIALLDNYNMEVGKAERTTSGEEREVEAFLRACCDTPVMKYVHSYLVQKGQASSDVRRFQSDLHDIWFDGYHRSREEDSSGFEHVFVGEIKNGAVTGLHNWLQLMLEERKGNLDYKGYINPRRRRNGRVDADDAEMLVTMNFVWHGYEKQCSSSLVGVSPEFELALYTLCFMTGQEDSHVVMGNYAVEITVHRYEARGRGKDKVGTSYPQASSMDENELARRIDSFAGGR